MITFQRSISILLIAVMAIGIFTVMADGDIIEEGKKVVKKVVKVAVDTGKQVASGASLAARLAAAAAKKAIMAAARAALAAIEPTIQEKSDFLTEMNEEWLPDDIQAVEDAEGKLEDKNEAYDDALDTLSFKKDQLAGIESNISAINLAIAVQKSIRDDTNASPSARQSAASEVTRLEGELTSEEGKRDAKNEEIKNYNRDTVRPALDAAVAASWELYHARGQLSRTRESIRLLTEHLRGLRAEKKKISDDAAADVQAIDDALATGTYQSD